MLSFIKEHPYASAGVLFGVGLVLVLVMSGGSDGAQTIIATPDNGSATAAGTAFQIAQLQAQTDMANIQANAGAQMASTNAALEIAKLESARQARADELSATVAQAQIAASRETQSLVSTLSAQVSQAQIQAGVTNAQIAATAQTDLAKITKEQLVTMAMINSDTIKNLMSQQTQQQQIQTDAFLKTQQMQADSAKLQATLDYKALQKYYATMADISDDRMAPWFGGSMPALYVPAH